MPPLGFRKRVRSPSPEASPAPPKRKAPTPKRAKPTLFDTADAPATTQKSLEENRKFLEDLNDDEDESALSEADSDDFEDVPPAKRRKTGQRQDEDDGEEEEEADDDEMEWEDAINHASSSHPTPSASKPEQEIADVSISVNEDGSYIEPLVSAATIKKGPSKRERQIRVQTHCLHVQALMWHNTLRNSWLNDKEVQKTLVDGLTDGVKREVQRFKEAMGLLSKEELQKKKQQTVAKGKGKKGRKSNEKSSGREWGYGAEHSEQGVPNLSGGDPLLRLLKVLTSYWKKRFVSTAPALRKQGYMPLRRLRAEIKAWEKNPKDVETHGERVESLQHFRKLAKECEGSRDVGAQLFVALLRGLGLETRMVANLQPAGFGWSKAEDANEKKSTKKSEAAVEDDLPPESEVETVSKPQDRRSSKSNKKTKAAREQEKPTRKSSRGNKSDPINLDDSDSPLSDPPSDTEPTAEIDDEDDDISVIDITPAKPKKKTGKKYDRDLAFPTYWTEVRSSVSQKYIPVDPIVLSTIASNEELLQTFEPRGKKAEISKQVICYTIAFAADGTAKDVTVRYIKRHQLPGKTKGMRMPVEKVPVYNRRGKVKKYEDYDWFRTLMSVYDRPESKRTAADDLEDQTDLKPFKPAKEEKEVAKESLQGYKQSADYVLEQHLRREEALISGAQPVKTFITGKGDKEKEFPVYLRSDIVVCKTVESWHKEGRAIKMGEQPLKYVPMRAVTLVRKREMEDAQRETGEKLKQGLYSEAQTDWIIPPPIQNGVIPKNAFGNMDVYVPTMVPRGAVHLPLKGSAKICRKLEIDYAEACTGFEFGKQRAVPILTGVVVAQENASMVRDAWRVDQAELRRKEDSKRTAAALHWWRKMLLGLRVLERMRTEYANGGGTEEEVNPFVQKAKREGRLSRVENANGGAEDVGGGGFFPDGYDEEEVPQHSTVNGTLENGHVQQDIELSLVTEADADDGNEGGGFLIEDEPEDVVAPTRKNYAPITPVSLQSLHQTTEDILQPGDEDSGKAATQSATSNSNGRKARKTPAKQPKTTRAKATKKAGARVVRNKIDGDLASDPSESDLTPLEHLSDGASDTPYLAPADKTTSPKVLITPGSQTGRRSTRNGMKTTPVRSQYFNHSDADSDDELEGAESSENEVIEPRKTTARTRARR